MNELFETAGFKKSLYKHLEGIDLDAVFQFCKSESFEVIVSGYLTTEDNSQEKKVAITTFFSENLNNYPVLFNEIEYLVLDLDFLYYSLPYFKELIEIKEVHELLYILKKAIYKNNKSAILDNQMYLETGFFDSIVFGKHKIIKINVVCFFESDLWLDYVSSNFEGYSSDYPLEYLIKFSSEKLLHDKETILYGVNVCANILELVSDKLKDDIDVVLSAVNSVSTLDEGGGEIRSGWALEYASNRLKDNREVVIAAVSEYGSALDSASTRLKDDKEVVFTAVTASGMDLKFASERLRDDKDIVLAAITHNAHALHCASARLQDDAKLVLEAVKSIVYFEDGGSEKSAWAIQYASQRLRDDKKFIIEVVTEVGMVLEYISDRFKDDKEVVIAAVSNDGWVLWYTSEKFRDDKDIVLAAVSNKGCALKDASVRLKDDEEVVIAAVTNDGMAFDNASERLRLDKALNLKALDHGAYYRHNIHKSLLDDRDIVLKAMQKRPHEFEHIPERFKADREIVLTVVGEKGGYGKYIKDCPLEMRDDPNLIKAAVMDSDFNIRYASPRLLADRNFLAEIIFENPSCILDIPAQMQSDPGLRALANQRKEVLNKSKPSNKNKPGLSVALRNLIESVNDEDDLLF